jgi:Opioid growth factor receptor (OGFr) conserved region
MQALDFFKGRPNTDGVTLSDILAMSDDELEFDHAIIQWCFPLHEPSAFNPDAPIVTPDERELLIADPQVRANMMDCTDRWLAFFGFRRDGQAVHRAPDFDHRNLPWLREFDHNQLRLTRVIRALRLFGFESIAMSLYRLLEDIADTSCGAAISQRTIAFWKAAAVGDLFEPVKPRF